jgi:gamma-glutamyltranspeptidase
MQFVAHPEPLPPLVPAVTARGTLGAVASPHHLASQAGVAVLRAGGNAVDAAIATNAALSVVTSYACGLGGDAFWLIWPGEGSYGEADAAEVPESSRLHALNGSGRSAAGATLDAARAAGLEAMPVMGPWTVTVPGAVRSWGDAHARFGRLMWADLLGPAIDLAAGFPASPTWREHVEAGAATFGTASDFSRVFRPHGRAWRVGERVALPSLGRTLRRLADAGPGDVYEGDLAARAAAYLEAAGSQLTQRDLATHASTWTDPIGTTYRGVQSWTHPPNSCGAVALELLNVLETFDPPGREAFGSRGVIDARWVHLGLEASRHTLADRDTHLTDPDAMAPGAMETMLGRTHAAELAARINPRKAGVIPGPAWLAGGGTVYLAVVDRWGGAVSLIESNYRGFGSGLVDPETGIAYQNRGCFFSLDPRSPNVLAPGKRTFHTLTPGMLFRGGRPWIVHGSMGGEIQPQVFAQFVSAVVDGGLDIATAVAAPRWVTGVEARGGAPSLTRLEGGMDRAVGETLAAMGHHVAWSPPFDSVFGHEHAIEFCHDGADGPGGLPSSYAATADPRSEGLPAAL